MFFCLLINSFILNLEVKFYQKKLERTLKTRTNRLCLEKISIILLIQNLNLNDI